MEKGWNMQWSPVNTDIVKRKTKKTPINFLWEFPKKYLLESNIFVFCVNNVDMDFEK